MYWVSAELPPTIPEYCVERAASWYDVPLPLLVAVLRQEGGAVGRAYPRPTGTYFGPGQISDKWVPQLAHWGFTADSLRDSACQNVTASAYVLAYYELREHDWSRAVARYNVGSLDTPAQREAGGRYASKVMNRWWTLYNKWSSHAAQ